MFMNKKSFFAHTMLKKRIFTTFFVINMRKKNVFVMTLLRYFVIT